MNSSRLYCRKNYLYFSFLVKQQEDNWWLNNTLKNNPSYENFKNVFFQNLFKKVKMIIKKLESNGHKFQKQNRYRMRLTFFKFLKLNSIF